MNNRVNIIKENIDGIPVLLVYNLSSVIKDIIVIFHKLLENKESELAMAYRLATEGFFVVNVDMHGHGERWESYEDIGFYDFNNLIRDCYFTAVDVNKILDYLKKCGTYNVSYENIGCIGISIGANIALITGYLDYNVKRIISVIGSLDWDTPVKNNKYAHFRLYATDKEVIKYDEVKNDITKYHPLNHYKEMAHLPKILFLNGLLDMAIPYVSAKEFNDKMEKIYCNAGKSKLIKQKTYQRVGHNVTYNMIDDIISWLKEKI